MPDKSKLAIWVHHYTRYLALFLIIIGIPIFIFDNSKGSDMPLLIGLFTLMITLEKREDERSMQIRTTSLFIAFVLAYALKIVITNLYDHQLIPFELVEINHFLILTLFLSNAIYYGRMYIVKAG